MSIEMHFGNEFMLYIALKIIIIDSLRSKLLLLRKNQCLHLLMSVVKALSNFEGIIIFFAFLRFKGLSCNNVLHLNAIILFILIILKIGQEIII